MGDCSNEVRERVVVAAMPDHTPAKVSSWSHSSAHFREISL